jgi:hypothetical protein
LMLFFMSDFIFPCNDVATSLCMSTDGLFDAFFMSDFSFSCNDDATSLFMSTIELV